MTGMRDLRHRMKSISDTRQITNAMRLISATKLRRARIQLDTARPYFSRVSRTMADILIHAPDVASPFFEDRAVLRGGRMTRGILLITGDKGLAGGYNHTMIRMAEMLAENEPDHLLYVVGHMGADHFRKTAYTINRRFDFTMHNPTVYLARDMTDFILQDFLDDVIDELYVVYTYMISGLKQEPRVIKLLPLESWVLRQELGMDAGASMGIGTATGGAGVDTSGKKKSETGSARIFLYEPSPEAVFDMLVPNYVKGILYGVLVEAFTCEQSARMTAMESATDNADEMLDKLRMNYNRTRQAAITREISEITSGIQGGA